MRPRVLTWHVHGSYMYYLAQTDCDFYLPVKAGRPHGYGGRSGPFPWPDNVYELPAEEVKDLEFDCVLYQARTQYAEDRFALLSEKQRELPVIYLEHDPPQEHPTNTRHWVDDEKALLVHVTPFNDLMWDSGPTRTRVIDHGVVVPQNIAYSGELQRGIVVINQLARRGRRLGSDVFEQVRRCVPLDLVGMEAEALGGLGEIQHNELLPFQARYRFFFNPIRYTSLGLSVCEAMAIGMPIVALATTEMVTAVENGVSGWVSTRVDHLVEAARRLLADKALARRLGEGARTYASERFSIRRFSSEWLETFTSEIERRR